VKWLRKDKTSFHIKISDSSNCKLKMLPILAGSRIPTCNIFSFQLPVTCNLDPFLSPNLNCPFRAKIQIAICFHRALPHAELIMPLRQIQESINYENSLISTLTHQHINPLAHQHIKIIYR
jgi:hypothetical protein